MNTSLAHQTAKHNPHAAPVGPYVEQVGSLLTTRAPHHGLDPAFRSKVADVVHNYEYSVIQGPDADGARVSFFSTRENAAYTIHLDFIGRMHTCGCGYFQQHRKDCKHIFAAARKLFPAGRECQNCGGATKPHIVTVPASAKYGTTQQIGERCVVCGGKEGAF